MNKRPSIPLSLLLLDIFDIVFDNHSRIDDKTLSELLELQNKIISFKYNSSNINDKDIDLFVEKITKEIKKYKHLYSIETNSILGADMAKINEILNYKCKHIECK